MSILQQEILTEVVKEIKDGNSQEMVPHRVFINQADTYHSKHIASYISEQFIGGPTPTNEEENLGESGEEASFEDTTFKSKPEIKSEKYEVLASSKKIPPSPNEDILEFICEEETAKFKSRILTCRCIIYDITLDKEEIPKALSTLKILVKYLENIEKETPKAFKNLAEQRIFVLISTVMTWAKTKPLNPKDPGLPFNESDYRKRRPHPNYKDYIKCEREVQKAGKKFPEKLRTVVICSGHVYGLEEEDLFFLFKLAWLHEKYLPIFSPGFNSIPVIYILDLAKTVAKVLESRDCPAYLLAVEQLTVTLKSFVKGLSTVLGSGKVKEVSQEEAFLYKELNQQIFERLTVNLKMEPVHIQDVFQLQWSSELNLVDNLPKICTEFIQTRSLKPLRIIIHGPPASGKTTLAKRLCEKYNLHYVNPKTVFKETIDDLRETIINERMKSKIRSERSRPDDEIGMEEDEEEVEEEEEVVDIEYLEDQMKELSNLYGEDGKELYQVNDEIILKLMKEFLSKNICQNQGYVLDGYPRTFGQATRLFADTEDTDEGEGSIQDDEISVSIPTGKLVPDYVVSLEADDDFLCNRVMNLTEMQIKGTKYSEEVMLNRLLDFRDNNNEDNTMLNYFDEIEVHPILIDVTKDLTDKLQCTFAYLCEIFGEVTGFGLTEEEEKELRALAEEEMRLEAEAAKIRRKMLEEQARELYEQKMEEWAAVLEKLQKEEEKILAARSEPLRFYLTKYIFPTLTNALIEVVKVKPDDPVDFLAEYLFKSNPEGKMFDPSYSRDGEKLLDDIANDVVPIIEANKRNLNFWRDNDE